MTHDLPPLPEPAIIGGIGDYRYHYTESQVRQAQLAAIAPYKAEIERTVATLLNAQQCAIDRGNRLLELSAENAKLRAEIERLNAAWDSAIDHANHMTGELEKAEAEIRAWKSNDATHVRNWEDALARAEKAEAEVTRLKAGGCARNQRMTQYCAEAVGLAEENAKLRELLRDLRPMVYAECGPYGTLLPRIDAALGEKK
jgi:chromosome segregation ATPase